MKFVRNIKDKSIIMASLTPVPTIKAIGIREKKNTIVFEYNVSFLYLLNILIKFNYLNIQIK